MTDTVTTTVEVATNAGHEALELTRDQTMALVEERGDHVGEGAAADVALLA